MKCFIVALKEETGGVSSINGLPVIYSGVGKINAARAASVAIAHEFNEIINIGSVGSRNFSLGEIIKVGKVYQDIDIRPLCEYGISISPWNKSEPYLILDESSDVSCFTTDYFYDSSKESKYSPEYLNMVKTCSVFDMELYALTSVCQLSAVKFSSFKWVSDDGDHTSWVKNCKISFEKLLDLKYF